MSDWFTFATHFFKKTLSVQKTEKSAAVGFYGSIKWLVCVPSYTSSDILVPSVGSWKGTLATNGGSILTGRGKRWLAAPLLSQDSIHKISSISDENRRAVGNGLAIIRYKCWIWVTVDAAELNFCKSTKIPRTGCPTGQRKEQLHAPTSWTGKATVEKERVIFSVEGMFLYVRAQRSPSFIRFGFQNRGVGRNWRRGCSYFSSPPPPSIHLLLRPVPSPSLSFPWHP